MPKKPKKPKISKRIAKRPPVRRIERRCVQSRCDPYGPAALDYPCYPFNYTCPVPCPSPFYSQPQWTPSPLWCRPPQIWCPRINQCVESFPQRYNTTCIMNNYPENCFNPYY